MSKALPTDNMYMWEWWIFQITCTCENEEYFIFSDQYLLNLKIMVQDGGLCHFESCPEILSKEICLYLIKNPAFQIQRNTKKIKMFYFSATNHLNLFSNWLEPCYIDINCQVMSASSNMMS